MMSSASTAVYEMGRWRSLGREPIRWIVMASWWMMNGPRENIAAVLTAFIAVGGSVLLARLNASVTQRQKEMDEAHRLQEYRRQLVEKRREERRNVYLRWTKAAQDVQEMLGEFRRGSGVSQKEALDAMKPLYEAYDELSLLDCPGKIVKLAAQIQRLQRAAIHGNDQFRGDLLIEIRNRMQADLSRDDDIVSPHRRSPENRFNFSAFDRRPHGRRAHSEPSNLVQAVISEPPAIRHARCLCRNG